MIIKDPNIFEIGDAVFLRAECKIRKIGWDTVYFKFEKKHKDFLVLDASPFAAALLIPSMRIGQDLIIEGMISKKLLDGMYKVMDVFLSWDIGLKRIAIKPARVTEDNETPRGVATFFSGGVDSFYTYLKHAADPEPVKYFIFVEGFDIPLHDIKLREMVKENIAQAAKKERVTLIAAGSNIRDFIDPIIPWTYTFGPCMAAVGLCLRRELKKIYIPASWTDDQQVPSGSHPAIDKYWSTEAVTFEHDGTEATRVDKVVWVVARSKTALEHLRVCYKNTAGTYNCGECEKCLRTMINLYIAGSLEGCMTLPHTIDPRKVAVTIHPEYGTYHLENLEALRAKGIGIELQKALADGLKKLRKSRTFDFSTLRAKFSYYDSMYLRGTLYSIWHRKK